MVAICIFIVAISSGALFISVRSPAGTLLWKLCWVMLCFIGLYVAHRMRFHAAVRELGLRAPLGRAGMAAFVASVPMLVMFALTSRPSSTLAAGPLLMTSVVSPLSEELLFRGYLFLQLYRRAGWSFVAAVLTTAGAFGLAHVGALWGRGSLGQLGGEMGMIAAGGAFYSWLLVSWRDNLWVPIALHGLMNLWCGLFGCDEQVASLVTNIARILCVGLALVLTFFVRRWEASAARAA